MYTKNSSMLGTVSYIFGGVMEVGNCCLIVTLLMVWLLLCLAFTGEGGAGTPGTAEDDHG
jgi:hypothetical protein